MGSALFIMTHYTRTDKLIPYQQDCPRRLIGRRQPPSAISLREHNSETFFSLPFFYLFFTFFIEGSKDYARFFYLPFRTHSFRQALV